MLGSFRGCTVNEGAQPISAMLWYEDGMEWGKYFD